MMEKMKESLKGSEDEYSGKKKVYSVPPNFFCLFYICVSLSTYDKNRNSMGLLFLGCDKAGCLIF